MKQQTNVPTITTSEKPTKTKDPKRVEAGKRLGAISKEAKAKKKERLESEVKSSEQSWDVNYGFVFGVVGTTAAVANLYYTYRRDKREVKNSVDKSVDRKDLMNELYDALLYTGGAVIMSMTTKKVLKESLGTPETIKGTVKLALAIGAGTVAVKYAESKKWLPTNPFKE